MDPKVRDGETLVDDNSAKKKFKFKSFKKLFGKKKRKETLPSLGASGLKSQSASDVTVPDSSHADYESEEELEATSGVLGSRAVSHDSIFIPEIAQEAALPIRVFSQENVSDRIKALQLKLKSNIKVGPPPFGLLSKRSDDAGASSEDDGLPRSPPEMSLIHEAIKTRFSDIHRHHHSSLSLGGTGSEEDEQVSSETSSRPLSPDENELKESQKRSLEKRDSTNLSPSADFGTPPQYSTFLDNSAARHRLSVKPRNQRLSKNRRPSTTLQEESFQNMTCMEEEDVTTPRPEQTAYDSIEADTPDADYVPDVSLGDKETSSGLAEFNESLNLPDLVEDTSLDPDPVTTSQSENVIGPSNIASLELDAKIKDQSQLVGGRPSENAVVCLSIVEEQVFPVFCSNIQKQTVKDTNKAPGEANIKPSAVEETVVQSSRTTSLEHSQESLHSKRSLYQNTSEKHLNHQDQPLSDKENHKQLGNGDKKGEKSPTETVTQRKFSVSSAWERPRTGSFSLKGNVESEVYKTTKLSLLKPGMSKTEILKEESKVSATNPENKPISRKTESLPDPEGMAADKAGFSNITPNQNVVPAVSDLPVVTESQGDSEEKNPFSVKLRSVSLSLRYRDGINPVSGLVKRHSAEFKLAKNADPSFSTEELNTEKGENKDHNVLSSKGENTKFKSESTEGTQAKPPLPKKPVLQNITVADNNTNKEASENGSNHEKKIKSSETKIEKKVSDRRPSLSKTIDKSIPVGTSEIVKMNESKAEPLWMSMARQKQRSLKEDHPVSENSIITQESEKQNRAEVHLKQHVDLILDKTISSSVSVLHETYGQDTKAEKSEQRQRANTLPHPVHATQLSSLTEKEEKTLPKRQAISVSQEPSWMELAKKKSQAWSDKPHIIK
ncbi:CRACD-like protein isoform X2 [Hyla sarda]|nr:CRACD-like protein isoform X2 [Hyla sarda]XP_056411916.1 CRACD-like protein isoform X2 [Hyla sarda]